MIFVISYRFFTISIKAIIFIYLFLLPNFAMAKKIKDSDYQIESIIANAFAENASQAGKIAVSDARRRAFKILLKKLEIETSAHELFNDQEIAETIISQQVDGERIAGNEYFATLNIVFDKEFIDQVISQKNLLDYKTNKKIEKHLILAAQKIDNQIYFWDKKNNWRVAVENNLSSNKKIFKTLDASINNLATIDSNIFLEPKFQDISSVAKDLNVDSAYILLFSYNDNINQAAVNITYLQNNHRKRFKLNFVNSNNLTQQDLLDIVAKKTISYLSLQDHKIDPADNGKKYIGIPISSLGHWLMLSNKLQNANFLDDLEIKMITRDFVIISIFYDKDQRKMENDFISIGLIINRKSYNYYTALTMN